MAKARRGGPGFGERYLSTVIAAAQICAKSNAS